MTGNGRGDVSTSVRQRLLNISRKTHQDFQVLCIRYAIERLLYRLSVSAYADQYVLKGAMLFSVWADTPLRATRDADFLVFGTHNRESLKAMIKTVTGLSVCDDGLQFNASSISVADIRENTSYNGFRITLKALLGTMIIPVQLDLGFGDVVTPEPVSIEYPALLEFPAPHIRCYPPESVIAEKVQAIVELGMANSRMKDYYDLWIILERFPIHPDILSKAVAATFQRRRTALPDDLPTGLTGVFAGRAEKQRQWQNFLQRNDLHDAPRGLGEVIENISSALIPVFRAVNENFIRKCSREPDL